MCHGHISRVNHKCKDTVTFAILDFWSQKLPFLDAWVELGRVCIATLLS